MAGKIGFRRSLARSADRGKLAPVGLAQRGEIGHFALGRRQQALHRMDHRIDLIAGRSLPQEHPASLAPPFGQPRIAQNADMARDARLALPEHLGKLAHGKLHRAEQAGDAQPGGIGERLEDFIELHFAGTYKDIFICVNWLRARLARFFGRGAVSACPDQDRL